MLSPLHTKCERKTFVHNWSPFIVGHCVLCSSSLPANHWSYSTGRNSTLNWGSVLCEWMALLLHTVPHQCVRWILSQSVCGNLRWAASLLVGRQFMDSKWAEEQFGCTKSAPVSVCIRIEWLHSELCSCNFCCYWLTRGRKEKGTKMSAIIIIIELALKIGLEGV